MVNQELYPLTKLFGQPNTQAFCKILELPEQMPK